MCVVVWVHPVLYPPDQNLIEQVWWAIRREISATLVANYEHLTTAIIGIFEKLATKKGYWDKWVLQSLSPRYASKLLGE